MVLRRKMMVAAVGQIDGSGGRCLTVRLVASPDGDVANHGDRASAGLDASGAPMHPTQQSPLLVDADVALKVPAEEADRFAYGQEVEVEIRCLGTSILPANQKLVDGRIVWIDPEAT